MGASKWKYIRAYSRYNKSRCFETFPFPTPPPDQADHIRDIAERLDAHRKRQQALHPKLTLTDCYNVLEKLRAGETLTAKDRTIHEQGLVTVLLQLHNDLDAAVAEAYGWPADLTDDEILTRLVDLNHQRAAEEARGIIRYLRPEYQDPAQRAGKQERQVTQSDLLPEEPEAAKTKAEKAAAGKSAAKVKQDKQPWPKTLPEQAKAVQAALANMEEATPEQVAELFKGAKLQQVQAIMETLVALGTN